MISAVPKSLSDMTANWLAEVLSAQSAMGGVVISDVKVTQATKWNVADTAFLEVTYGQSAPQLPRKLFAKLRPEVDPLAELFPGEQRFYEDARTADLPVAPCFAAIREQDTGATCILLQDLRETHTPTDWPLPPTLERCKQAVGSLAKVHAHWLQQASDALHERDENLSAHVSELLPAFFAAMGDRLPKERASLLERACSQAPRLKAKRYESGRPVTRIHGDAHFWNVLYPIDSNVGEALLIDWEDWRIDFAAADLAFLIAMHWYPDRRRRYEKALLQDYLSVFCAHGARGIAWDELWQDYRLGHICNAVIPIFQHAAGHAHGSWWSHLERWFLAFDDLDCRDLL